LDLLELHCFFPPSLLLIQNVLICEEFVLFSHHLQVAPTGDEEVVVIAVIEGRDLSILLVVQSHDGFSQLLGAFPRLEFHVSILFKEVGARPRPHFYHLI